MSYQPFKEEHNDVLRDDSFHAIDPRQTWSKKTLTWVINVWFDFTNRMSCCVVGCGCAVGILAAASVVTTGAAGAIWYYA